MGSNRWIALFLGGLLLTGCGIQAPGPAATPAPPSLTEPDRTEAPRTEVTEEVPDVARTETTPIFTEPEVVWTAEAAPTEAPEPDYEAMAREMPTELLAAQVFLATPEALTGGEAVTQWEELAAAYEEIPVGGFLFMGPNLRNPDQTRALLEGARAASLERTGLVPFLSVDEEGGTVARISGTGRFGVDALPDMAEVGARGDPEEARAIGAEIGGYLRGLGFNLDFAPCADVLTNPDNRVVRRRSFGSDPESVIALCRALSQGLEAEGILPCWKHFPGHGGTAQDSHRGFALLELTWEELLESRELAPFLAGAEEGVPMIMVGHIAVPAASGDDLPASLSPTLISILRDRGYDGLLITDALNMGAITQRWAPGEAAVQALLAGNDLLLAGADLEAAYRGVLEALDRGVLTRERLERSVVRILRAKAGIS